MDIDLYRFAHGRDATLGHLHVNGDFQCFTCEDQYQIKKVKGETRIPTGRYEIELRTEGNLNASYTKRFAGIHKGMLWLRDVPNFKWIYIHVGNNDKETEGCLLVGQIAYGEQMVVGSSTDAYIELYIRVITAIKKEEPIFITIYDRFIKYGS